MSDLPTPTDTELETQRTTAALLRSIDVPAPASLHYAIRELNDAARKPRRKWSGRPLLAGALASGAALIAVLVLLLSGSEAGAPTVQQASALAMRPATLNAPAESPGTPGRLAISAAGIVYPYWGQHFGWQAVGARSDSLGGHTITTVFYSRTPARDTSAAGGSGAAQRIGYAIVAGPALPIPAAGHSTVWRGVRFQVLRSGGATVVTWRRAGHTCILVGSGVSSKMLLTLANWQAT